MRRIWKRAILVIFAIVLCVGMLGCGKNTVKESRTEKVYVSEFLEITTDFEWISYIIEKEGIITFCGDKYSEAADDNEVMIKQVDIATLQQTDMRLELGENTNFYGIAATADGYVSLVEEYVEGDSKDESSFQYSIHRLDDDWNKLGTINITEALAKAANAYGRIYPRHLIVDKADNIYVCTDTNVWVFNSTGSLLFDTEIESRYNIAEMKAAKSGQVFLVYAGYGDAGYVSTIKFIDLERQTLSDALGNIPNAEAGINVFPAAGDKLYISTPATLYTYDITAQYAEELLAWGNCDIVGSSIDECIELEDGTIVVISQAVDNSSDKTKVIVELTQLRQVPADSVTPKKELILAILSADSEAQQWVADFNRRNSDYRINIKAYVNDDYSNYDEALMQFNIDMALGNKADIIIFPNGTDISMYASRGALADLNEFMETDPELQKEDFIPNILDTLSVNDKLYAIGNEFNVRSLVGKVSDVGTDSSWTIADVKALVEANPDKLLINLLSQEYGLRFFLEYSMDSFYDEQSGGYDFETREFRELLELVATFPKEYEWTEKELMIHDMYVFSYYWLQAYEEIYGESVNMIGYPVEGGSGHVAEFHMLMAIGARSQNKEGAWQFIRQFLTPEAQCQARWGFPISKQAFEEWIADAMTPVAEESKNRMVYDNVEVILDELTEERAELLRDTVYGVTSRYIQNEQLYNIIAEEAGAYFAGQKTVDEVIEIIQNRVQVYAYENQ